MSDQDGLGYLAADVTRLLRRAFRARIEGSQLTFAQARALVYIARQEGVRQVELAEHLDIQPITLARLIDQLAQVDVVERRSDPNDRRAHQLFLKPSARPHLAAIDEVIGQIQAQAQAGMTSAQAKALADGLRTMRANLSESSSLQSECATKRAG